MVGKQDFSKTTAAGSGRCSCFRYISADSAVLKKRAMLSSTLSANSACSKPKVSQKQASRRKNPAVVQYLQTQQHPPDMCPCGCLCIFNIRAVQLHRRSMHKSGVALADRSSKISTLRDFGSRVRVSFEERRKGVQYVRNRFAALVCNRNLHGLSSVSAEELCHLINVLAKV